MVFPGIIEFRKGLKPFMKIVGAEMNDFREYIDDISEMIELKQESFESMFENDPDLYIFKLEEYKSREKYFEHYILFSYNSSLVTLQSYIEARMMNLCDLYYKMVGTPVKSKDLAGRSSLKKSQKYISKFMGVDLESFNEVWSRIMAFQRLRNIIVHNYSNLTQKDLDEKFFQELLSKGTIKEKYGEFYISDKNVVQEYSKTIEDYLIKLLDYIETYVN